MGYTDGVEEDCHSTAAKGRDELVKQLATLRAELEPLEYAQAIADGLVREPMDQRLVVSRAPVSPALGDTDATSEPLR